MALGGEAYRRGELWKWRFNISQKKTGSLDLDMASSGQRANWPVVLLGETLFSLRKRGKIQKDFTIFVEEPEVHLHPAAQVEMVNILAYLVNNGFRVVVTTHSLTILYALNNLVMANSIKSRKDRPGLPPEKAWLPKDNVAAYALGDGKPKNLVDKESGFISEQELGYISEELHETMNRISSMTYKK